MIKKKKTGKTIFNLVGKKLKTQNQKLFDKLTMAKFTATLQLVPLATIKKYVE